jgi:hypothetical protein
MKEAAGLAHAAKDVIKVVLGRAPSPHAGVIGIAFLTFCISLLFTAAAVLQKEWPWGFGGLGIAVAAFLAAMYFVRPPQPATTVERNLPVAVIGRHADKRYSTWSRAITKGPVPPAPLSDLIKQLRSVRLLAQSKYKRILQARSQTPDVISEERVRTNVFLADTSSSSYGVVCRLYIPERLHHGMLDEKERGIRFRPSEGLTGRVFSLQEAFGGRRDSESNPWQLIHLEGPAGPGDEAFPLTQEQTSVIAPDLRWIVSYPLKTTIAGVSHTIGVLNIDGMSESLTPEEMQSIYHSLSEDVAKLSAAIAALDKQVISICVEDLA